MKLALGTAQFGLPYGVANITGRPCDDEVRSILRAAQAAGVQVLDTACLYGESEATLGRCLPPAHRVHIVTKTPKFPGMDGNAAVQLLESAFAVSCERLRMQQLYGLLTHDAGDLLGPAGDALWKAMRRLRAVGRVTRIGASVYSGAQIDALLHRYPLDLIQLPLSLLDQRLVQGGQLDRLAAANVEVHARSAFLQGALLMPVDQLPQHLAGLRPFVARVAERAATHGISTLQAALRFVAGLPQVAAVVCGVDSRGHFGELVEVLRSPHPALPAQEAAACACTDAALIDPSRWRSA